LKIYIEFNNVVTHFVDVNDEDNLASVYPVKEDPETLNADYYCLCFNPPTYKPELDYCVRHVMTKEIVKVEGEKNEVK
jgi:hypothetical protein